MIEQIEGMPAGTVGFRAIGRVTSEDYENILVPEIEAVFSLNNKLRVLYHLGDDFEGFDLGAMWDDAKLGLRHLNGWDRVAVVTDMSWVEAMVSAAGFMRPAELKMFPNADLQVAKAWIAEGESNA